MHELTSRLGRILKIVGEFGEVDGEARARGVISGIHTPQLTYDGV